jgi:hypothetical protein
MHNGNARAKSSRAVTSHVMYENVKKEPSAQGTTAQKESVITTFENKINALQEMELI